MVGTAAAPVAELRRAVLPVCVLALIQRRSLYGYELARIMGQRPELLTSHGTLYPLLLRLEENGLVTSVWRPSPAGPRRKYYANTAKGSALLRQFRREWPNFVAAVDACLAGDLPMDGSP